MNKALRILVAGPSWVGDMVMAQSLLMTLKQAHPNGVIDVLAPAWTFPLLARMPEVGKAIAMPFGHGQFSLAGRYKMGRQINSEGYDQAILLPNSWKSALIPYFADIPLRTGYVGECRWGLLNDARTLDKRKLTMTVQRFVALGLNKYATLPTDYPKPALMVVPYRKQAVIDKFGISRAKKIVALCPGAEYGPAKRWPPAYFSEVASQKIKQGWQVWLFGSAKDKDCAEQINSQASGLCRDFTGSTSLAEAVDLMSLTDAVVTNDSGLMHVAAALNKKIIALYGSSDPAFTPPLSDKAKIISLNLDCAPCFKRECPLYPKDHEKHTLCLTGIKPAQVLDLLDS